MSKPLEVKDISIPDHILRQLLTPSEMRMLKNRWRIVNQLEEGLSIRKIAEDVKVGSDTVVRVSKMMNSGELQKVLDKEKRGLKKIKTSTPWIFGKTE
ncbi:MAG: Trp family transcriptional regulator [Candidatus Daviesbacteria bacterium]|nr:Trp family transcriptional regulator [Candidatus Daviesbacteria bacterium]